ERESAAAEIACEIELDAGERRRVDAGGAREVEAKPGVVAAAVGRTEAADDLDPVAVGRGGTDGQRLSGGRGRVGPPVVRSRAEGEYGSRAGSLRGDGDARWRAGGAGGSGVGAASACARGPGATIRRRSDSGRQRLGSRPRGVLGRAVNRRRGRAVV